MNLKALTSLTKPELAALQKALPTMTVAEKIELMDMLDVRERRASLKAASSGMLGFANAVYPGFKVGPHHRKLAKIFEDVIAGKKKRVIINIAPRMGKSEFSSYLFPAYFLGKFPEKKIIMGTHTAGLSEDFGRRVRNLIDSEEYAEVFNQTIVAADQKAAGKWSTSAGGQYYAAGVGGALAGRGADLFVIDDPHSEQDVKTNSRLAFDTAWSWFQTGPLQRLMPGGAIIVIMTRWSLLDLTGRLIDYQTKNPEAVPWEIVELPAILNEDTEDEKSLWPEQWPLHALKQAKASMDPQYWNAQYMQQPAFVIEKKAAGAPLIQELRNMGIFVQEFTPSRGNDKIVRMNAVADLFSSGKVWAPDTRWAREVIEEVASFPNGEHDDYVDTTSQALLRFRQGGFIPLDSDEKDDPVFFKRKTHAYY